MDRGSTSTASPAPIAAVPCSPAANEVANSAPSTNVEAVIARLYEMALPQDTEPIADRGTVVLVHENRGFLPARPLGRCARPVGPPTADIAIDREQACNE